MNQNSDLNDDLRPEYDFSQMPIVQRGPGRKQAIVTVQLEPDVAALFPNAVAVNEALRFLIRSMRKEELRIENVFTIGLSNS
jgi:hypothetical protein